MPFREGGMWNRLSSVIAVSVIAILTTASPGNAQFRVCNKAKEKIDVAFGYDGGRQGFIAEGWWVLAVNQCATVMSGALGLRYYYVYGKGYDGTKWDGSDDRNPGSFCVKYEKFTLYQRQYGDNEQADCKKELQKPDYPAAVFATDAFASGDNNVNDKSHHGTPDERAAAVVRGFETAYRERRNFADAIQIGINYISRL